MIFGGGAWKILRVKGDLNQKSFGTPRLLRIKCCGPFLNKSLFLTHFRLKEQFFLFPHSSNEPIMR
jgi:hypothetical protein